MTTVGVTMSVYNGAGTVGQALASVAAQTRRPDQVIVVDDGSTDGSLASVEPWQHVLPLTIVRHGTNRGLARGRTSGIEQLRTDVVLAIDADDAWLPHHLARMVAAYEMQPGIVSPMAVAWDPTSTRPIGWRSRVQRLPRTQDIESLLVMNWLFSGSLFEKAAFEAAGARYRFSGCDDWDLWLRLTSAGARTWVLEEPTVLYRVHGASMSADDRLLPMEIQVLEAFLGENRDPRLRAVARRSLRHRRARTALRTAYEEARQGRSAASRVSALRALRGPGPVGRRGAVMVLAPGAATRSRDRAHRSTR